MVFLLWSAFVWWYIDYNNTHCVANIKLTQPEIRLHKNNDQIYAARHTEKESKMNLSTTVMFTGQMFWNREKVC
jgi:hypothetical protein